MIKSIWSNPMLRFLIIGSAAYISWIVLYKFYLEEHTFLDEWVIDRIVRSAEGLMSFLGFDLIEFNDGTFKNHLGVLGSKGVTIGAPCNGIVLFALFIVFILAFPGKWRNKLWFLPLGVVAIHYVNTLRVIALALIVVDHPEWLAFNHDYTFTILVYAFVFLLWYIWVNTFSPMKNDQPT
ncbi:MAG: exosortase family protein XrtF [Flavobacteriales bacterium]|jgi:exosortase family protein XrtF|nr:exosortase family protein XrtF [Flavobacteriales bacterium]